MEAKNRVLASKHFLNKMIQEKEDIQVFTFNLLAFLSASRSITWVLQNEFSRTENFVSWYADKQKEMRQDNLLTFFKEMRNVTIKEKSPGIKSRKAITFTMDAVLADKLSLKVIRADGTEETFESQPSEEVDHAIPESPKPVLMGYYFLDWTGEDDIISLCEQYVIKIELIVDEAYNLFY